MIIVSACLGGMRCTYNGRNNLDPRIRRMVKDHRALPVCPERLGGLKTPRERAEISGGGGRAVLAGKARVLTVSKKDVTRNYVAGARLVLKKAREHGALVAVLKSKSPACGLRKIYDGTFSKSIRRANGVLSQLLLDNGIFVMTEKDL